MKKFTQEIAIRSMIAIAAFLTGGAIGEGVAREKLDPMHISKNGSNYSQEKTDVTRPLPEGTQLSRINMEDQQAEHQRDKSDRSRHDENTY